MNYDKAAKPSPNPSVLTSSSSSTSSPPVHQHQQNPHFYQHQPQYQQPPLAVYNPGPPPITPRDTKTYQPRQKYRQPPPPIPSSTLPHRMENHTSYKQANSSGQYNNAYNNQSPTYQTGHSNRSPPNHDYSGIQNQSPPVTYPSNRSQSQNSGYNPGIVYADLTLPHNGHTNRFKKDYNTEYAVLQFNSPAVGQEIDV